LRVDCAIERICEIDRPPIAADLDHLRPPLSGTLPLGCVARDTMPPIRNLPVSFGLNGSLTSYCWKSPVPQHDT
jgi:hypothetical protein